MTYYYLDPLASGTNDGGGDGTTRSDPTDAGNWTNAWESMAEAIAGTNGTAPAAGDVVFRKHTNTPDEVITTTITNAINGTYTDGYLQWITVNSSGVIDGSRYHLDCDGNDPGLYLYIISGALNYDYGLYLDTAVGASNLNVTGQYNVIDNLFTDSAAYYGIYSQGLGNTFYNIKSTNNGWDGVNLNSESKLLFSTITGNASEGVYLASLGNVVYGCVIHGNTHEGIEILNRNNLIMNNVLDANTLDNIKMSATVLGTVIIGNRITESGAYGINFNAQKAVFTALNYTPNASEDRDNTSGATSGIPPLELTNGNIWDGTDTDGGYTTPASDDFNLTSTATLRRTAIELP